MHLLELNDGPTFFEYLFVFVIGIIIYVAIVRAVFKINTFVRHTRAQTNILAMIAEKLGVDPKRILRELNRADDTEK